VQHAVRFRTSRLVIRRWSPADASLLSVAIESNLEHLREWLPWARDEPSPQAEWVMRLARWSHDFEQGRDWPFALLISDERVIVGGAGLHRTAREDTLEVGCWLSADATGIGLASEATAALCHEAFYRRGTGAVALRCSVQNGRAVRLAERLGFSRLSAGTGADELLAGGTGGFWAAGDAAVYLLRRDDVALDSPVRSRGAMYEDDDDPA